MIPIILLVNDETVYFNSVMFLADELEVGRAVIIDAAMEGRLVFYQTDKTVDASELKQLDYCAYLAGYPGVVQVQSVSESRAVFGKPGLSDQLMVLELRRNNIVSFQEIPEKRYYDAVAAEDKIRQVRQLQIRKSS